MSWNKALVLDIGPCVDPGMPSNGRRLDFDFGHKRTVTFQCNPKYSLVGNETIRCQDGLWSGHLPKCKCSNQVKIPLSYLQNIVAVEILLRSPKLRGFLYVPE